MSLSRNNPPSIRLLTALGGVLFGIGLTSCGTDAVGISTCREVEEARCEAALQCELITDVDGCKRFARDHCLHGVGFDEDLSSVAVRRCVADVRAAGDCAARGDNELSECGVDNLGDRAETVCEIVQEPELAPRCRFLVPPEPESEPEPEDDADAGD